MKILFLTNNPTIAQPLISFLKTNNDIYHCDYLLHKENLLAINPDIIISYNYRYILDKEIITFMEQKKGAINLHISYLPYNRGADPNFWSIVEGTPTGVTIHKIDKGLDTGDILLQKKVAILSSDTLATSYKRLHKEIQKLFISRWENIRNGTINPKKQKGTGTYHARKDFYNLKIKILRRLLKKDNFI